MIRISLSLLLAVGLLSGCAPKVPTELINARQAYLSASTGDAATLVPAEVHKAHQALLEAEAAFEDDAKGYHTLDLAYVAQRKAETAEAMAATATEAQATAAANMQYQTTQDAIMHNTRDRLGEAQSNLSNAQIAAAQSNAKLSASENARFASEQQVKEARAALAKLASVTEESRGIVITLSGSVLFRSDESTLLPEAKTRLDQVAEALLSTMDHRLIVEGHTDSQGAEAYNLALSQRRAEAVTAFLVERGYAPAYIRSVGIGEARPIANNDTPEGRANNRRVEIIIEPVATASQ